MRHYLTQLPTCYLHVIKIIARISKGGCHGHSGMDWLAAKDYLCLMKFSLGCRGP